MLVKTEQAKNRNFVLVAFPSAVANDVVAMLKKLEKSKLNKPEFLGDLGGFRMVTHFDSLNGYEVFDETDPEGQPIQIQDFANILLRRLEALEQSGKWEDSEDLAFIMGELTMLRDGSFLQA